MWSGVFLWGGVHEVNVGRWVWVLGSACGCGEVGVVRWV